MSQVHRHQGYGRVRRPKNILGDDYTTVAGNASSDIIDNTDPVADLREDISAVAVSVSAKTIQFTTADSRGTDVFDGVTGTVFTKGLSPLLDNIPLRVLSTTDASNITVAELPVNLNNNQISSLSLSAGGTLNQRTKHGAPTENARFLHLYLDDTGDNSETVQLWGYNYAFGLWSPIQLPLSLDKGDAAAVGEDADADNSGDTLQQAVAAGTVNNAFADATFTVTSAPRMFTVPINGIDRVYFKIGSDRATVTVGAAISTF